MASTARRTERATAVVALTTGNTAERRPGHRGAAGPQGLAEPVTDQMDEGDLERQDADQDGDVPDDGIHPVELGSCHGREASLPEAFNLRSRAIAPWR